MMRHRFWPFVFVLMLWSVAASRDAFDRWIDQTVMPSLLTETSVEVVDRQGKLLRVYTVEDGLWRLGASPRDVDQRFLDMLIAYEDKRFYTHSGVDMRALARAAAQAALNGRVLSGGSTLTMQVARLLENSGTGRIQGKLRQMRLAWALERKLSKDQILALYLTHAPYGGNIEGIRAATLIWLGKEPTRLTPAQAALLIALPQSPEKRRPDRHISTARAARDRVLFRLGKDNVIDEETYVAAVTEVISDKRQQFPNLAPHLADRAVSEAPESVHHTLSIDKAAQEKLEILAVRSLVGKHERLSIAVLVADHQTGEILASVGSAGYTNLNRRNGFVDMTKAIRSPGSTLKPLVYGMGIDEGLVHPETLIVDKPVQFGTYAPNNFDGSFRGELRVADALRLSLNIPVVLLADQIGPARIMSALRKSGTNPVLPSGKAGLAIVLGGIGMSLQDLVQLYAMQARGGVAVDLTWRMEADTQEGPRVLSRAAAWQVGNILSSISPPAGMPSNRLAYKTGTSYGHRDAWAVGYDGQHVAGVWIGRPDGTPVPGVFGGDLAAPVLFEVFQALKPELAPLGPPPPETLMVSAAQLPEPLKRFKGRNAVFTKAPDSPKLAFPPNGAKLFDAADGLTVKMRDGLLPFTVFANGRPVATKVHQREVTLFNLGKGASNITIIDAKGRADKVGVWIE